MGLASVILALCVPLIVPGLHPSKLFSSGPGIGGSGGDTAAAVALPDTLSQTMKELQQNHPTKVLTYTLNGPSQLERDPPYLQTYVYDALTDSGWQTTDYVANDAQAGTMPAPQGLNDMAAYRQFRISVNVAGHALTNRSAPSFLAIPYPATQVTAPPGVWLVDPELMVFSQASAADVAVYTATSVDVDPTAGQLEAAPRPPSSLAADLALPKSYEVTALKRIADDGDGGPDHGVRQGQRAGRLALGADVLLQGARDAGQLRRLAALLPDHGSHRRVRAVGVGDDGAHPPAGHPGPAGGRLHRGRRMSRETPTRSRPTTRTCGPRCTSRATAGSSSRPPRAAATARARASSYQSGTAAGSYVPPPSTGQLEPTAGPTTGTAKVPGRGHEGASRRRRTGEQRVRQVRRNAVGGGRPGDSRRHRPGSAGSSRSWPRPHTGRCRPIPPPGPGGSRPASLTSVVLVVGAAAIVALALYRLLSHTSGLDLRAGWATVGIAFGAACAFMFVTPGVGRIGIRRWRWLRARDDTSRAHTAWREFQDDLQDLGVGCAPSEPPRTLADRVSAGLAEPARGAVRRIALAEERASYAARPSGSAHLRQDGTAARRGLAASVRPRQPLAGAGSSRSR